MVSTTMSHHGEYETARDWDVNLQCLVLCIPGFSMHVKDITVTIGPLMGNLPNLNPGGV